jgi:hypothetical protein
MAGIIGGGGGRIGGGGGGFGNTWQRQQQPTAPQPTYGGGISSGGGGGFVKQAPAPRPVPEPQRQPGIPGGGQTLQKLAGQPMDPNSARNWERPPSPGMRYGSGGGWGHRTDQTNFGDLPARPVQQAEYGLFARNFDGDPSGLMIAEDGSVYDQQRNRIGVMLPNNMGFWGFTGPSNPNSRGSNPNQGGSSYSTYGRPRVGGIGRR